MADAGLQAQGRARARDRDADRARAADAAAEILRLRAALVSLADAESGSERQAGGASASLILLRAQETALKLRIARNQQELSRMLGALQMYRRNPPPALLVDPRSARDAARAAILVKAIAPELERRSRAFAEQARALARVRDQSRQAAGVLASAQTDVAERRARIQDLIIQKTILERQLNADAATAEADVRRLASQSRSVDALAETLQARAPVDRLQAPASLRPPVAGAVDRRFGEGAPGRPASGGWSWRTQPGALVRAPAEARVDYAGPLKGWGQVLILRLNGGYQVVLAGLGEVNAGVGRAVSAGEPVGRMGTGAGPELYLEVRREAQAIDPAPWLQGAGRG